MSRDWPHEPQDAWEQGEPPRPGMSTAAKVVLILAAIFGGTLLICCGGLGWFVYQIPHAFTDEPQAVRNATQEIVRIEVPERFRPAGAVDFGKVPFFGRMIPGGMKLVMYESDEGQGALMLMEISREVAGQMADPQRELRDALRQQGREMRELDVDEDEEHARDFEIRGKTVSFTFTRAEDPQTGTAFRQVMGTFDSNEGVVLLFLQLPAEQYDEAEIVRMIESIE